MCFFLLCESDLAVCTDSLLDMLHVPYVLEYGMEHLLDERHRTCVLHNNSILRMQHVRCEMCIMWHMVPANCVACKVCFAQPVWHAMFCSCHMWLPLLVPTLHLPHGVWPIACILRSSHALQSACPRCLHAPHGKRSHLAWLICGKSQFIICPTRCIPQKYH